MIPPIDDAPAAGRWVKAAPLVFGSGPRHRTGPIRELQQTVAAAATVRAVGGGDSGDSTVVTVGDLVLIDRLPSVLAIDPLQMSGCVDTGNRYGELTSQWYRGCMARENLSSMTHMSVADAFFGGVHGPGNRDGSVLDAVTSVAVAHWSLAAQKRELR